MRYFIVTEEVNLRTSAVRGVVLAETREEAVQKVDTDGRFPLGETSPFYLDEMTLIGGE